MQPRSCFLLGIALLCISAATAAAPALPRGRVLPLRRRDGVTRARGLLRNASLPLHGAIRDYGYFYAQLTLGTPAAVFAVIVDTGSTITYVPCASCGGACGPHHQGSAFDPAGSSSSAVVGCGSAECSCGRPPCGCSALGECTYSRTYAEQSSSSGVLLSDALHLRDGGDAVWVVFGCETQETGEIYNQAADGILGLGNSPVSIINQLAEAGVIEDTFALCFGGVQGGGALLLGDVPLPPDLQLHYTPLLVNPQHPHYYVVQLQRLAMSGVDLEVPEFVYQQGYGTVLDSGTTFTYLPSPAFTAFLNAVRDHALAKGLQMTDGPDTNFPDVCFGGAPGLEAAHQLPDYFPTMDLHFGGGVSLRAGPLNYLFVHAAQRGAYCLGVFDNGGQGTLLGGITFRNVLVQYDRRNARVGFGQAACGQLGVEAGVAACNATAGSSALPEGSREELGCDSVDGVDTPGADVGSNQDSSTGTVSAADAGGNGDTAALDVAEGGGVIEVSGGSNAGADADAAHAAAAAAAEQPQSQYSSGSSDGSSEPQLTGSSLRRRALVWGLGGALGGVTALLLVAGLLVAAKRLQRRSTFSSAAGQPTVTAAEQAAEEGARLLAGEAASSSGPVREAQLTAMPPALPKGSAADAGADAPPATPGSVASAPGGALGSGGRASASPHSHAGPPLNHLAAAAAGSPGSAGRPMSLARGVPGSPASLRGTPRGTPASTPRADRRQDRA